MSLRTSYGPRFFAKTTRVCQAKHSAKQNTLTESRLGDNVSYTGSGFPRELARPSQVGAKLKSSPGMTFTNARICAGEVFRNAGSRQRS
jgi:hypothetical protein